MTKLLISPGYTNSGPDHWQTHLEAAYDNSFRVQQHSWERVDHDAWVDGIQEAIDSIDPSEDIVIVGHSCGAVAVAQWACERPNDRRIRNIVLVAPADVDASTCLPVLATQASLPGTSLPYPCFLVTSDDDPFLTRDRALEIARRWNVSEHQRIRHGGHLSTDDGYGRWLWIENVVNSLAETSSIEGGL